MRAPAQGVNLVTLPRSVLASAAQSLLKVTPESANDEMASSFEESPFKRDVSDLRPPPRDVRTCLRQKLRRRAWCSSRVAPLRRLRARAVTVRRVQGYDATRGLSFVQDVACVHAVFEVGASLAKMLV